MTVGASIIFAPGTEVSILNGNDSSRLLIQEADKVVVMSYDDYGVVVRVTEGPAVGRRFYISKSTPAIMMEV